MPCYIKHDAYSLSATGILSHQPKTETSRTRGVIVESGKIATAAREAVRDSLKAVSSKLAAHQRDGAWHHSSAATKAERSKVQTLEKEIAILSQQGDIKFSEYMWAYN